MHHTATVHSTIPIRWLGVRYPGNQGELTNAIELHANQPASLDSAQTLPASTPLSQPYWLRAEGTPGMFRVEDAIADWPSGKSARVSRRAGLRSRRPDAGHSG